MQKKCWSYIDKLMSGSSIIQNGKLIGALSYSGQYKALCHIAPFITPESKIYPFSVDTSFNLSMSAFPKSNIDIEGVVIENDGKQTAVIVNPNSRAFQVQIELDGKLWYLELHPNSIITL